LPPASDVGVSVGPADDPVGTFDVVVGDSPQPGLDRFGLLAPAPGGGNLVNLGLTVFFRYHVYLDPVGGRIGLGSPR